MRYFISCCTDEGRRKKGNQDSILVQRAVSGREQAVLAVLCDGMGGLDRGDMASASVVKAFSGWMEKELSRLRWTRKKKIFLALDRVLRKADRRLRAYSGRYGLRMGTTATVLLLFRGMYYIAHVGDSRVYELGKKARQVTSDQTLVAEEVKRGLLTEEQAGNDPRRNILLQCVGGNGCIPEHICGTVKEGAVYLVCSDGFCHEISAEEMKDTFCPEQMQDEETLEERCRILVERNLERGERDNISVIAIRTEKERRNAGNRFGH